MEDKKLLIIVIAVLLIGGGLTFYYLNESKFLPEEEPQANTETEEPAGEEEEEVAEPEGTDTTLERVKFSILLPAGWKEVMPPEGVSLMFARENEKFSDSAVDDIGFKSYIALNEGDREEMTIEEYYQFIKQVVLDMLGEEKTISEEGPTTVGGSPGYSVEIDTVYGGVELKVWIVMVKGEGTTVWNMSFNTTKDKWSEYKEAFTKIAESFVLK